MGNPGDGVLLDEEDPDVAGLGRVQVQRGHHVLQQALQPFPLSPVLTVDTFFLCRRDSDPDSHMFFRLDREPDSNTGH